MKARLHLLQRSARTRPCRLLVLAPDGVGSDALQGTLDDVQAEVHDREGWALQRLGAGEDLASALERLRVDSAFDVAWITAGTRVAPGWRARMQEALHEEPALGTVSALSLDRAWFSPLPAGRSARGLEAALAGWLAMYAPAEAIELGAPMPDCGVLRAEAAAALAAGWPEGMARMDWAARLAAAGWVHAVTRRVLVHGGPLRDGRSDGLPTLGLRLMADPALWAQAHPLAGVRHAVGTVMEQLSRQGTAGPTDRAAQGGAAPSSPRAPMRLHVAHSWGGGLSKWVQDFIHTDTAHGTGRGLVLRSVGVVGAFGQRLALYDGTENLAPLRFWELGVPIHATAVSHLEVRRILQEIIEDFGVEQVIVSSLIGHSLDVLRTGLPTVVVAHDHHPFCITLYATFGGECRECPSQRLERCIEHNPGHRFFREIQAQDWLALRQAFVETVSALRLPIAAPSRSVAERWQSMMPALDPRLFHVIAHGIELPPAPPHEPPQDGPLRVVVLGRLSPEKGSELLAAMRQPLLEFAHVMLVGCGERIDPLWKHPRVTVVEHFVAQELPATLAGLRPDVGLLVSVVPETFSYALSELWHAGIPVVATANGALADRIEHGRTGFLEPAEPPALLERLRALHQDRSVLQALREQIRGLPARSLQDMVRDYEALLPRGARWHGPASGLGASGGSGTAGGSGAAGTADASAQTGAKTAVDATARYRRALHVNPEATWMQAARGFWQYTCHKAARSPRLPAWARRWFERLA